MERFGVRWGRTWRSQEDTRTLENLEANVPKG